MSCSKCGEEKPETEFYMRANGTRRRDCKACIRSARKAYYRENKSEILKNINPRKYEHYDRLIKECGAVCQICGKSEVEFARELSVDHCHETGAIRGLLCINCNVGLGHFKDSPELLQAAIDYLARSLV